MFFLWLPIFEKLRLSQNRKPRLRKILNCAFITSYERDIETELDFAQARMYSYFYGRFTSPDNFFNDTQILNSQSWNLYSYVRNNPLRFIDPSGMMTDFINYETGEVTTIEDGKDQVIAADGDTIKKLNKEFNSLITQSDYSRNLRALENSNFNLHMTRSEFINLAEVIYAETSEASKATWQEAAAIHGVLRNRALEEGDSVLNQANSSQVNGSSPTARRRMHDENAPAKVRAVFKGIALSIASEYDASFGAYFWQGTDFRQRMKGTTAHQEYYENGFRFTDRKHDIWGLNDSVSKKPYKYKYESTAAYGDTTFMKLTEAWKKANGATRWNGK